MGFALPAHVTVAAVRSYRTFSPLPAPPAFAPCGARPCGNRRYILCGTFRKTRFERVPPAVSRHAALWRPDFPPDHATKKRHFQATTRPGCLIIIIPNKL